MLRLKVVLCATLSLGLSIWSCSVFLTCLLMSLFKKSNQQPQNSASLTRGVVCCPPRGSILFSLFTTNHRRVWSLPDDVIWFPYFFFPYFHCLFPSPKIKHRDLFQCAVWDLHFGERLPVSVIELNGCSCSGWYPCGISVGCPVRQQGSTLPSSRLHCCAKPRPWELCTSSASLSEKQRKYCLLRRVIKIVK